MVEQKSFICSLAMSIAARVSAGTSGPSSLAPGKREGNAATTGSTVTFLLFFGLVSRPLTSDF